MQTHIASTLASSPESADLGRSAYATGDLARPGSGEGSQFSRILGRMGAKPAEQEGASNRRAMQSEPSGVQGDSAGETPKVCESMEPNWQGEAAIAANEAVAANSADESSVHWLQWPKEDFAQTTAPAPGPSETADGQPPAKAPIAAAAPSLDARDMLRATVVDPGSLLALQRLLGDRIHASSVSDVKAATEAASLDVGDEPATASASPWPGFDDFISDFEEDLEVDTSALAAQPSERRGPNQADEAEARAEAGKSQPLPNQTDASWSPHRETSSQGLEPVQQPQQTAGTPLQVPARPLARLAHELALALERRQDPGGVSAVESRPDFPAALPWQEAAEDVLLGGADQPVEGEAIDGPSEPPLASSDAPVAYLHFAPVSEPTPRASPAHGSQGGDDLLRPHGRSSAPSAGVELSAGEAALPAGAYGQGAEPIDEGRSETKHDMGSTRVASVATEITGRAPGLAAPSAQGPLQPFVPQANSDSPQPGKAPAAMGARPTESPTEVLPLVERPSDLTPTNRLALGPQEDSGDESPGTVASPADGRNVAPPTSVIANGPTGADRVNHAPGLQGNPASSAHGTELGQELAHAIGLGNRSIRLQLAPPGIGQLSVDVRVGEAGGVHLRVAGEAEGLAGILRSQAEQLQRGLAEQGLSLEAIDYRSPGDNDRSSMEQGRGQGGEAFAEAREQRTFERLFVAPSSSVGRGPAAARNQPISRPGEHVINVLA